MLSSSRATLRLLRAGKLYPNMLSYTVLRYSSAYFAPLPILESLIGATGAVEVNRAGAKNWNLRIFSTPHDFRRPSAYTIANCCLSLSAFVAAQKPI
jgi:hypothetical protein